MRRDRVEGGAGLVEEDDLRLYGQEPRDAEPLLGFVGQKEGGLFHLVFEVFPEADGPEAPLHDLLVALLLYSVDGQAVDHVLIHGERERVGPLEDHPDPPPQIDDVERFQRRVVDQDAAVDPHALHEVVHAVEAAQQGRFPAPGRADEGRNRIPVDLEIDVLQGMERAVIEVDVFRASAVRPSAETFSLIRISPGHSLRSASAQGW